MPRGNFDWGVNPGAVTTTPEISSSELAVRLGALANQDRLGEMLFQENFNDGSNRWGLQNSGAGSSVGISTQQVASGKYSLLIHTDSTIGSENGIYTYQSYEELSKIGLQCEFAIPGNACAFTMYLNVWKGSIAVASGIRVNTNNSTLQVLNAFATWQTVKNDTLFPTITFAWNTLKLVIDPSTGHYVRAIYNGLRIDLSSIVMEALVSSLTPTVLMQLHASTTSGGPQNCYIDNIVLTQNEP